MATTGGFMYIDPSSIGSSKPWGKVDDGGNSYTKLRREYPVTDLRSVPNPSDFTLDTSGFALHQSSAREKAFTDQSAIQGGYYAEVEQLLRDKIPGVKKVVIFDHTVRKHDPASARQPVQLVHVDQTPRAAAARVRRHVPDDAEELLKGRYQLINVWRPISHPATDFPLAFVDWRTTTPKDFVKIDLMFPNRQPGDDDDDRGKEALPDPCKVGTTDGYTAKGETFGVVPASSHGFYYVKDMTPDEAVFIKCFDSRSEWMNDESYVGDVEGKGQGVRGRASAVPHTAFVDPQTPRDAPGRQSIEVRALVFHES
ncbi:hypothetical protein IAU60_006783 [Kwoniella sp. DSM 27419]